MNRDYRKLKAFELADAAVVNVYGATRSFPIEERFGLQSQIRRAAVSVTANIVEGSARHSEREYLHFLDISLDSASEVSYLFSVARRLGYVTESLESTYDEIYRVLVGLTASIRTRLQISGPSA